jgi:hypothetical protein
MDAAETRHKHQPLAGGTMKEIYEAKWLRETEAQMAQELEQEYAGRLTLEAVRQFIADFLHRDGSLPP